MTRSPRPFDTRLLLTKAEALARARWVPLVVFLIAPLVVFPSALLRLGLMDGGDDALSNLPFLVHSARRLLHGEILWTTDLWMGTPLVDEPEFATFYLPRLGLLLGPPTIAFGLYVASHYVIAEIGAFLYARALGLGRIAAVFGGLAFAFTGFMLGHRGHTMYVVAGAWTPFVLYGLTRIEAGAGRRAFIVTAVAYAAIVFSGAVQLAAYLAFMVALLYATRAVIERNIRPLAIAAVGLVPGILLSAVQIIPSVAAVPLLASDARASYEFSTALSYDVRLLPLLVIPQSPYIHAELFSRCGAVVFTAAAFSLFEYRTRKRPIVTAWAVVAAVALVLMLGKHVPFVARALHALPILDVFRGPVRHNYELGTAMAVLAAFGLDAVVAADKRVVRRAALFAFALTLALALSGFILRRVRFADLALLAMAKLHSAEIGLACASCLAFVVASTFIERGRGWALALIALLPLVEARRAGRLDLVPWLPVPHTLPSLDSAPGELTRILTPSLDEARVEALTGNSALLLDGVQNLHGYASMAPRDAAAVLDLDMHGNANDLTDLTWSRLPTIFGVTHVIMPEVVCGDLHAAIDPARPLDSACSQGTPGPTTIEQPGLSCVASLDDARRRYFLSGDARRLPFGSGLSRSAKIFDVARRDESSVPIAGVGVQLGVFAAGVDGSIDAITLDEPELSPSFKPFSVPIDLLRCPPRPRLMAEAFAASTIELRDATLGEGLPTTVAELTAMSALVLEDARVLDGVLRLGPSASVATAELWFDVPPSWTTNGERQVQLELIARSVGLQTKPVAVDLYASASFDPESAQLVAAPETLGEDLRTLRTTIDVGPTPGRISLRVTSEGSQSIEVQRARLRAMVGKPIVALDASQVLRGNGSSIAGDVARLLPTGTLVARVALPVRPLSLTLDLEASQKPSDAPLVFGAHVEGALVTSEVEIAPTALVGRRRVGHAVGVPADASSVRLFVRNESAVTILGMSARDACLDRHYRPVKTLGAGLVLYRALDARPRAWTVTSLIETPNLGIARAILRDSPDFDPTTMATIEGARPTVGLYPATIADEHFDGALAELTVDAPEGPAFVVVNDRWDPSWSAEIDARPTPLRRVNALVRGILVPQGRHRVRMFRRVPLSLWVGFGFFLLGCLALWVLPARWDRTRKT